ncbi:DUF1330 domain-containing protein [Bosea sp. BIWAKO-01]|uniref:DUF1330 domain-containing protein n=1 Tax=Bosea sp. BIWAKO-01 TaxID=506668 RepID=UPI00085390C6|nr:DUF1330 domain-containing protein [Bosea sp. BIWAKO-01]GAU81319.1 hypothetical protein BIWAKO_01212 [Bosea sp. BIWAKO-01]
MAKGYWVARVDVEDQEAYARYRTLNAIAFAKFGAKFLVRGGEYKLARGEGRQHNVVIEFKDEATARACYESPEYQEAVKHLAQAGKSDLVIIGGYDGPQPAA